MKIESSAFANKDPIPKQYTCDGVDVSPPLQVSAVPPQTKSLVLIVDDPDAPHGTFDHWIVWNLPPDTKTLTEGGAVPREGINGFQDTRYRGPCPPKGKPHRYFFKLYALDKMLTLEEGSPKQAVEQAMQGHVLEQAELVGVYGRN
jgi:Raf kinase inhibitor-like YbhB/YbcL family protein